MALMLLTAPLVPSIATPSVIFADCDGTMLGPDHRLSKKTRQSLQALSEAGIAVVPATGRAKAGPWTSHVLSEPALKGGAPGIYMNGGMTVDEEGLVSCSLLSASAAATTLDFAADAPVTAMVYSGDQALVDSSNHLISRLSEVGDAPIHKVDALEGALHNTAKILLLVRSGLLMHRASASPCPCRKLLCRCGLLHPDGRAVELFRPERTILLTARSQFDEDDVDAKELRTSLEHHVGEIAGVTQVLAMYHRGCDRRTHDPCI